jgi:TolB-like protein
MKKIIVVVFAAIICFSHALISFGYEKEIKSISSSLADNISKSGKKTIAIVDFTDLQGNITELGRFISEEISSDLTSAARGFEVIDRTHLKTILEEHKLSMLGLIDPKSIRKLGQITGAEVIVTGTVTPFGDSIRVSCKAIVTETTRIFASAKGDIPKTKAIEELLARGIQPSHQANLQPSSKLSTPSGPNSKTVGNIIITAKRISVSRDKINVALDFFNKSNSELKLGINNDARPNLIDDRGNRYNYSAGIVLVNPHIIQHCLSSCLTLYPQSNNDAVLSFSPTSYIELRDIGTNFELSASLIIYDHKTKTSSTHNVSMHDIKTQTQK